MSVSGYMYNINATKKLADIEIKEGYEGSRSWHHQFRDSAYVYVGGLKDGLSEGDVVIVFSQFGEIVDVNLVRDRSTGKSKGFCFLCYEDQKSTILAVDNMNGATLLGRTIRVDHVSKYKATKNLDEDDLDENGDPKLLEYTATGAEGAGQDVYNVVAGQRQISEITSSRKKVAGAPRGAQDEDEAWANAFEQSLKGSASGKDGGKKFKKDKKSKKDNKSKKDTKNDIERMKEEMKRLKEEAKLLKASSQQKKSASGDAKGIKREAVKTEGRKQKKAKSEESSSSSSSPSSNSSGSGGRKEVGKGAPKRKR